MKKQMQTTGRVVVGVAVAVLLGCTTLKALDESTGPAGSDKIRVGVYDSRAVALCYYRSEAVNTERSQRYERMKKELEQAEAAKDDKKIKELKDAANAEQNRSHWQVFGDMPAGNIIEAIQPELKQIALDCQVVVVVAANAVDFSGRDVELVDITDRMVQGMAPSEETRKIMKEMKKHKPVQFDWLNLDMD